MKIPKYFGWHMCGSDKHVYWHFHLEDNLLSSFDIFSLSFWSQTTLRNKVENILFRIMGKIWLRNSFKYHISLRQWSLDRNTKFIINPCHAEKGRMPHPLLIFSRSDSLIQVVDRMSHTDCQIVQIQIHWLLKTTTDLDPRCLQKQDISGFSRTKVKIYKSWPWKQRTYKGEKLSLIFLKSFLMKKMLFSVLNTRLSTG